MEQQPDVADERFPWERRLGEDREVYHERLVSQVAEKLQELASRREVLAACSSPTLRGLIVVELNNMEQKLNDPSNSRERDPYDKPRTDS